MDFSRPLPVGAALGPGGCLGALGKRAFSKGAQHAKYKNNNDNIILKII
jgi:hypothetical protein